MAKKKARNPRPMESGQYYIIMYENSVEEHGCGGKEDAIEALEMWMTEREFEVDINQIEIFIGEKFKPILEVKDLEIVVPI